ncbi:hypothetical protein CCP3SC15_1780001 [Gammaproteobacteria bacterium]
MGSGPRRGFRFLHKTGPRPATPDQADSAARCAGSGFIRKLSVPAAAMLSRSNPRGLAMTAITFDTLKFVEQLTSAGVPEAHAKAEASAFREILSQAIDTTVATKGDIARLENRIEKLDNRIDKLENRLENRMELMRKDIKALELNMTIRLGALLAAATGIIIAALRMSLPHL